MLADLDRATAERTTASLERATALTLRRLAHVDLPSGACVRLAHSAGRWAANLTTPIGAEAPADSASACSKAMQPMSARLGEQETWFFVLNGRWTAYRAFPRTGGTTR